MMDTRLAQRLLYQHNVNSGYYRVAERSRDNWRHSQGYSSPRLIGRGPGHHPDAVNNGTDTNTQCTACTILSDMGEVCQWVKGDGLVA